jgi:opacity protein-like surface antigen
MIAYAWAVALALGPGGLEDPLPRRLSDPLVQEAEALPAVDHAVLVGLHLGVADRDLDDDASFLVGLDWRIHILPWLAAGGSLDLQTEEQADDASGAEYYQLPVTWYVLLSPPLDLGPFRPYGLAGGGFTVTYASDDDVPRSFDINLLYCAGVGVELKLAPRLVLDAGFRFVQAQAPSGFDGVDADWTQVTIGLLYRMTK